MAERSRKTGWGWGKHKYYKRIGKKGSYRYFYSRGQYQKWVKSIGQRKGEGPIEAQLGRGELFDKAFQKEVMDFVWPKATEEELELARDYMEATGDVLPFYMDPYFIDRTLRIVDAAFLASGVGVLAKGVTGAARIGFSRAARAAAKSAVKAQLKNAVKSKALVKGASAKAKRKVVGKAIGTYWDAGMAVDSVKEGTRVAKALSGR